MAIDRFASAFSTLVQGRCFRAHLRKVFLSILAGGSVAACLGPDIAGSIQRAGDQSIAASTLPAATMIYPPVGYQTTSNTLLIKAGSAPAAVSYVFEAYSGSTLLASQTLTAPVTEGLLTFGAGSFGTITVRLSYRTADGKQSPAVSNDIVYLNFAAGQLVKALDYTTMPTCSACSMFLFLGCSPYSYNPLWPPIPPASNCPAFPNDNWTNCQSDSFVAEGNAWICAAAPEGSLYTNHNVLNTYHPATTGYNYSYQDVSLNTSSYQHGHNTLATNEALIISCRVKRDSECGAGGKDAGLSLWYYPYRDATTTENVQVAQRDCSGTWSTLASLRVSAINQIGQSHTNKLHTRIDCLGDYFTAYYKQGSEYIPMAIVKDTAKFTGRAGWGFGPGHPTNAILHRVSSFEWRRW